MDNVFTWLKTRDGSPTLWNNALAESFRSTKGAFSESWVAFVNPALDVVKNNQQKITVGEFGLGAGTNWLIWSLAAKAHNISFDYFAIERDLRSFEMALVKWKLSAEQLQKFFLQFDIQLNLDDDFLNTLERPQVFPSLEEAQNNFKTDIWFHDPFGYEVNPDGYSIETIHLCRNLWKQNCHGYSYACNRIFQNSLKENNVHYVSVKDTGVPLLKKYRIEWIY